MKIDRDPLKTGVPLIDMQHSAYFDLVERLFTLRQQAAVTRDRLAQELDKVLAYAVEHFDTEEHLMRSSGYPCYEEHFAKHSVFRDHMDQSLAELKSAIPTDACASHLTEWLVRWVSDQVLIDDVKLAEFLKAPKKIAIGAPFLASG